MIARPVVSAALVVALGATLTGSALAQESAHFRLREWAFNAGGDPLAGQHAASAHYGITLDSVGDAVAAARLASLSFRMDGGFVPAYPPPGEVRGLRLRVDRATLDFDPERSAGSYNLYRDLLTTLSGGGTGACLQYGLQETTAIDASTPPGGNGWFYLVTVENRLSEEGAKGSRSDGSPRPNPVPCP